MAISKVREWLGGLPGGPGVVGSPSRRAWTGWESPKEGREEQEALQKRREGSGVSPGEMEGWEGPAGELGGVVRFSRMDGRGREALLEGWEGSGGYPGGTGKVGRPWGRESSEDPFRWPGGVGRTSRRASRGWETLPEGQEVWDALQGGREG